eukprot:6210611-Pleurochrysis_carterae.AAC.2
MHTSTHARKRSRTRARTIEREQRLKKRHSSFDEALDSPFARCLTCRIARRRSRLMKSPLSADLLLRALPSRSTAPGRWFVDCFKISRKPCSMRSQKRSGQVDTMASTCVVKRKQDIKRAAFVAACDIYETGRVVTVRSLWFPSPSRFTLKDLDE